MDCSNSLMRVSEAQGNTTPSETSRVVLGSAQFGMKYGVANVDGKVSSSNVGKMLHFARKVGIKAIDTAMAYGDAESVLGGLGVSDFKIISKLTKLRACGVRVDTWVVSEVRACLDRLRIDKLYGLLLHSPDDLLSSDGRALASAVKRLKDAGMVERVGISVYSPDQLSAALKVMSVDIVQLPFNVLDRRFADSGWLERLFNDSVEVHARSIFLQGLLVLPADKIPTMFSPFRSELDRWHDWVKQHSIYQNPMSACIAHVSAYREIARLVVGVDSYSQLEEIVDSIKLPPQVAPETLSSSNERLVMPSTWSSA